MRAYVVDRAVSGGRELAALTRPQRLFWEYLQQSDRARASTFEWPALCADDLAGFEAWLHTAPISKRPKRTTATTDAQRNRDGRSDEETFHGHPRGANSRRGHLEGMVRWASWLRANKLLGACDYDIKTPDPRRVAKETIEGIAKAAADKLPPDGVLAALASIYWRLILQFERGDAVAESHVYLASLVVVQMLTGLRANELLKLPVDCERWQQIRRIGRGIASTGPLVRSPLQDPQPEYRYGIAFFVEKSKQRRLWVRWISPTAEPIVREAIARIRRLTEEPRLRAAVLANSPDRVPLPEQFDGCEEFTREEVLRIFALADHTASLNRGRFKKLPRSHRGFRHERTAFFRRVDVEALLQEMRDSQPFTIRHHDGTVQNLAESLCVIPVNYLMGAADAPRKLLVTKTMYSAYNAFLGGANGTAGSVSIFEQYGTTDEIRAFTVSSHAFRHWLTTVAYHGGMPLDRLTLYFARIKSEDTLDYVHPLRELRDEEVAEYVQEEIAAGRVFGDIALTYWSLPADPPEIRKDYLATAVRVGHVTPWGICLRDFAIAPCDKHLDCLNACEHYCCTKGDMAQIKALEDLEWRTAQHLRLAANAASQGEDWGAGHADHHERRLRGVRAALAFHRDETVPDGTVVNVFGGRRSLPLFAGGRESPSQLAPMS
jgi:hypothetical protein